ncbi:unnamed protein product [Spirodela intermedia]|uniref:Uncharacterized protein n=1 Tax=Spirodela intermedia TaxID=51605 RepID=A0A7I8IB70_SPIIN|nr:unnamed protein product [Spirodela intermedia]CAA6654828.1 unnamed protein product [Spirodela intermedia]
MRAAYPSNLLDDALGTAGAADSAAASCPRRRFVLVEDCVETSGAFVLHHFVKRALPSSETREAVIFLALAQNFSHYDRVLRKLGCNLSIHRDKKKLFFLELLKLQFPDGVGWNDNEAGFIDLYGGIQRTVESCRSPERRVATVTILIDDISLLEIAAGGSADHVLDFLHYCVTLTSEMGCSLIVLTHEDVYSHTEGPTLLSHLEYLADTIIRAEPLRTGLSADVHGQGKAQNFHFRVKENSVDYFYPGTLA